MENLKQLQERVAVSDGRAKADLVIKNGRIINVFSGEIMDGDIAIKNGYIAGIGSFPDAEKIIDAAGAFIAPGLLMHMSTWRVRWSHLLSLPVSYSQMVLQRLLQTRMKLPMLLEKKESSLC